jgi:hypothetical protein
MTKLSKILLVLCIGMAAFGAYGLYREHVASAVLDAQTKAAKTSISDIQTSDAAKMKDYQAQLAALAAEKQKVVTVTQVIHELPQYIALPQPVAAVTQKQADGANAADPTAKPIVADDIVIPKADAVPLFQAQVAAKECAVQLAQKGTQYDDLSKVDKIKDTEIAQRDVALKGGTKWARTKTALKWVGAGALIGGGAVAYLTHK